MNVDGQIYFAPGVPFTDINPSSPEIVAHFQGRIFGYYLVPAARLAEDGHGFAAVLLSASAIDALARYSGLPLSKNRDRYISWIRQAMPSMATEAAATQFYEDVRCGLVHEARAKLRCTFDMSIGAPAIQQDGVMIINPRLFVDEVAAMLCNFCDFLLNTPNALRRFQRMIAADFNRELENPPGHGAQSMISEETLSDIAGEQP
jgi:hypothetical protein